MNTLKELKDRDCITIDLFGKEKTIEVYSDKEINEDDLEDEIDIFAIAVNIGKITQSVDGFVYPEISFFGDCECDPEHGICIGFRDKKFLGVHEQDWTL